MKKFIFLTLAVIFSVPVISQNGVYKSNNLISYSWDYSKNSYLSNDTIKSVVWKVYFCPSKNYYVVFCNGDILAYETIKLSEKIEKTKVYDGDKGSRVMYYKEEKAFIIFHEQDYRGRYKYMYVMSGYFTKMSNKKIKETLLKEDFIESESNEIKI